jgi:uncharacterized protein YegJ (DUF2314 family)
MKRRSHFALLAIAFLAACPGGCSSDRDQVTTVDSDDPEMVAAIAKARAELPRFWQTFANPAHGESDFALKVKITDANGTEHFWLSDLERKDGKTTGTINNDAVTVKSVKLGDRIPIPEADISDWMYMRGGKMYGNGTVRALFKEMPPAEVEKVKKMLAEP